MTLQEIYSKTLENKKGMTRIKAIQIIGEKTHFGFIRCHKGLLMMEQQNLIKPGQIISSDNDHKIQETLNLIEKHPMLDKLITSLSMDVMRVGGIKRPSDEQIYQKVEESVLEVLISLQKENKDFEKFSI